MENQTITINETEYNVADLASETVALINRVYALRAKRDNLMIEANEVETVINSYSEQIVASVSEETPQEELDV